jgi:hypothetical protein
VRYPTGRGHRKPDLAILLKVCPHCLGDLVAVSDFSGDYYSCLQCDTQVSPRARGPSPPAQHPRQPPDFLAAADSTSGEGTPSRAAARG